jgi:hypothetical protein
MYSRGLDSQVIAERSILNRYQLPCSGGWYGRIELRWLHVPPAGRSLTHAIQPRLDQKQGDAIEVS